MHSKLQAHFSLNLQEMYDLNKHIGNIKVLLPPGQQCPAPPGRHQGQAGAPQGGPDQAGAEDTQARH